MMRVTAAIVVCGVVFLGADPVSACSCVPTGPPCAEYWQASAVFVGRVEAIHSSGSSITGGSRVVQFAVHQAFRGVSTGMVEVRTGRGGGDCGYRFREGREYLVYAFGQNHTELRTGICTRTRPIEDAATDLAYARSLAGPDPPAARISGQVMRHHRRLDGGRVLPQEPLAGVRVRVQGEAGGFDAVTDRYGVFEITGAEPGSYAVSVVLPDGYYTGPVRPLSLPDRRACADVSIAAHDDGRVGGRVVDSRGVPIAGLTLDLTTTAGLARPHYERLRTLTAGDGAFEFARVPPGRFVVGVNTQPGSGQPRVLHPGVERVVAESLLTLDPGERVTLPDFVMPPEHAYVHVNGVVLDTDGYFAAGARVYLAGPVEGDGILGEPAITDPSGRFVLAALAGRAYRVFAERTSGADAGSRTEASDPISVTAAADLPPVKLTLRARY